MYPTLSGWDSPLLHPKSKDAIVNQLEPFFVFLPGSLRAMLLREMSVQILGQKLSAEPLSLMSSSGTSTAATSGSLGLQNHETHACREDNQSREEHDDRNGAENCESGEGGYRLTISMEGARIVAMGFGVELRDAYLFCMANGLWPLRFVRNAGSLTLAEQEYLLRSRVTVVGCGALGGFVSILLARIGIGSLVLCDDDVFEETNLNRQFFCDEKNLGKFKVEVAQETLEKIASHLLITPFRERATKENLPHILTGSHALVDCVDSVSTRIILDEAAVALQIPYIHGALAGLEGFCGVSYVTEGYGLVRQMYGDVPIKDDAKVIQEAGLFASTASSVASLEALLTVQTLLACFHGQDLPPKRLIHLDLLLPSLTVLTM